MHSERASGCCVGSDESGSGRSWARCRWARCSRIVGYEWREVVLLNNTGGLFCGYCSGMESVLPPTATTRGDEMVCEAAAIACDSHRFETGCRLRR
jgi:hypothetical protein